MEYYCIMVETGGELEFKKNASDALKADFPSAQFFYFERTLRTNKGIKYDAPMFPGYVFLQIDSLNADFLSALRRVKGFYRILRDNLDPTKFQGASLAELEAFIQKGERWGFSKVEFESGKPIKVISGPLAGLEGKIYKINKKKKRITIISSIFPDKRFDLMYEDLVLSSPAAQ